MTNSVVLPRKLIIFGIVLPLAAFVGYLLASPDFGSFALIALFVGVLTLPLFLRWHHAILVFTWNLSLVLAFLPGAPPLWMPAGLISLSLVLLSRILDKDLRLLHVPSVSWSLLFLGLVVLFTMKMTGTIGLRSLGGTSYGGKKYFFILFAIAAYFALSSRRIPLQKANFYTGAFLLPGLTLVLSSVVYMLGPSVWFLYYLLPTDVALGQAIEDMQFNPGALKIGRIAGFAFGGPALLNFMLARYGVRGILDWSKPWRLLVFVGVIAVSLLGGFRSVLILNGLLFVLQFFLEGMHKTYLSAVLLIAGLPIFAGLVLFADKLPLSAQRTLSFLPIKVHPAAQADAMASTDWRLRMWQVLWPEVPKYFWIGKGYTASATDYYLASESARRGLGQDYEASLIAGDYHSGPLSIMVPFGIFGVLAFIFFLAASLRVLHLNYRDGHPRLKLINTFLYSCFIVRVIFFLAVFGGIHVDIVTFAGLVGLSISLNGGVARLPAQTPTDGTEEDTAAGDIAASAPLPRG